MAIENPSASQEGRLSGAYIRSLVKQLTSPKPKTKPVSTNNIITTNNHNETVLSGTNTSNHNIAGEQYYSEKLAMAKQPTPQNGGGQQGGAGGGQQGGHKKQVRRRLHTSRPYQERLLNMAEARKEIVTALKFHRATMKQANERKQQQQQQQQHQSLDQQYQPQFALGVVDHEEAYRPNGVCASYYPSYHNNYHNGFYHPWNNISPSALIEPPPINNYETLNMPLPNQTLGLNLNLQAFTNLDTTFSHSSATNTTISSMMSPSSSSSSVPGDPTSAGSINVETATGIAVPPGNHPALDENDMATIRSIGEKHQIEWDDTLNLVKSAWWLKFLKEFGNKEMKGEEETEIGSGDDEYHPFGELMEFPAWLSANEGFLQQHLDECCPEEYWNDNALPWMDIEDIDGMDDEWLS